VEVGGSDPSNPAQAGWYCAHLYRNNGAVRAFTVGATFVQEGNAWDEANFRPWVGWWWVAERNSARPHLYDTGGSLRPLDKYDAYITEVTGANPATRANEIAAGGHHYLNTPSDPNDDWFGHCHAWSASAIFEPEPRIGKRHTFTSGTIDFSVGDLKGLLSAAYDNYTAVEFWGDDKATSFHSFLSRWVRGSHRGVLIDETPGTNIYFHPLYKYIASMVADTRNPNKVNVTCSLYWQTYGNPDDLTPSSPNPRTVQLKYWLEFRDQLIVNGSWVGPAPQIPDYMIGPDEPLTSGCGGVWRWRVREIINTGVDLP
jgi:hypothetical protein